MQNRKPMVLVLAGPNGSGKSTITAFFEKVGKYTNADDIVASTGIDNMEAAILADKMWYKSIEKKEDFTFETVLSSDYKLEILRKAKKEGYFIKCVFVLTIDPQINISRIKSRVAAGGHDVEKIKVIDIINQSIILRGYLTYVTLCMCMIIQTFRRELFASIKMIYQFILMNIGVNRIYWIYYRINPLI